MLLFAQLTVCVCVCWQGAARGLLRQQREASALSAGDHRMADSQRRGAVGTAAHRRRCGSRAAPERVSPGKVSNASENFSENINFHSFIYLNQSKMLHILSYKTKMEYVAESVNAYKHTDKLYMDVFSGVLCLVFWVAEGTRVLL